MNDFIDYETEAAKTLKILAAMPQTQTDVRKLLAALDTAVRDHYSPEALQYATTSEVKWSSEHLSRIKESLIDLLLKTVSEYYGHSKKDIEDSLRGKPLSEEA